MKKILVFFLLATLLAPGISQAALADDLSGRILLQVEQNGEAWYVYPESQTRYYLGRPNDAFDIMRTLGLGIKHDELTRYLNYKFPARLSGRIMLDVEQNGEAYYVNPKDLKGYYLGRPTDAFNLMRTLGLGITDANLDLIAKDESSAGVKLSGDMVKFSTASDFSSYIENMQSEDSVYNMPLYNYGIIDRGVPMMDFGVEETPSVGLGESDMAKESAAAPSDVSETNVQVAGIDEPDMVKTNGTEIFYSPEYYYYGSDIGISVVDAWPVSDLNITGNIQDYGTLLLDNEVLLVLKYDGVYGYDVSDPVNPVKKWSIDYNDAAYEDARLYNGELYLITRNYINDYRPCPFEPVILENQSLTIACSDIYHPVLPVSIDSTYTVLKINPENGQVNDQVSFVGNTDNTVYYMSENSLYVTYLYQGDLLQFGLDFLQENTDLFSDLVNKKIAALDSIDISDQAKMTELSVIINNYFSSLDEDESLRIRNEINNRMNEYVKVHIREIEQTGLVKILLNDLEIVASGSVPGELLNQFSLDEYQGKLRLATTIGNGWIGGRLLASSEMVNDVYVLDEVLKPAGEILDLGLGERIYSARFVEDKGYLVTFRQIDPFFVLDLSDYKNPKVAGELKIPGYSSYLHPLKDDLVLGVGDEDWKVKLSLFDVSDPNNPIEISKYLLDSYWSEVQQNHHAFLQDARHEIFFLPAGGDGFIFSYANNKLSLTTAVAGTSARRALYLDDYLYIVGDEQITVYNENTWEKVNTLELPQPDYDNWYYGEEFIIE